MKALRPAIVVLLVLSVVCLASCKKKGKVIPPDILSEIYADMFMADQWVIQRPAARRKADTTFLYEPIFREYGYSTIDYVASVHYYLEKPDKYSKIIKRSAIILDKYVKRLQAVEDAINNRETFGAYERRTFVLDSLVHEWDSLFVCKDTTLAVTDSLLLDLDSTSFDNGQTDTAEVLQLNGLNDTTFRGHPLERVKFSPQGD